MKRLLDDELAPITNELAFFGAHPAAVRDWLVSRAGQEFIRWRRVTGKLDSVLRSLLPLLDWPTRELVVPTRSEWTAYFNNVRTGTDASGLTGAVAEDLRCPGVRAVSVPHVPVTGPWGATMFTLWGPEPREWLNLVRAVELVHDGYRWEFTTSGEPQTFERLHAYAAPRRSDRFTHEMLTEYLGALRIDAFEAAYYASEEVAYLIEVTSPIGNREFTLDEARRSLRS